VTFTNSGLHATGAAIGSHILYLGLHAVLEKYTKTVQETLLLNNFNPTLEAHLCGTCYSPFDPSWERLAEARVLHICCEIGKKI